MQHRRQSGSLILVRLGIKWGKDRVQLSFGMVELPEGKRKHREGTAVDADDLMDDMVATAREVSAGLGKLDGMSDEEMAQIAETVGLGALKYFQEKVQRVRTLPSTPRNPSTSTEIQARSYSTPMPVSVQSSARM